MSQFARSARRAPASGSRVSQHPTELKRRRNRSAEMPSAKPTTMDVLAKRRMRPAMHLPLILRARKPTARPVWLAVCIPLLLLPPALLAQDEKPGIAFSTMEPGAPLPAGWKNLPVVHGKPMTQYTLVHEGHTTVMEADANRSASGLMHEGN